MTNLLKAATISHAEMAEMLGLMVDEIREAAILLMDPQGVITVWNAAAASLKGYAPEEAVGRFFGMLYTPQDQANGIPQRNLRMAAELGYFRDEGWRQRKDGTVFWARVALTALRDDQGRLVGYSKLTLDMTAKKALQDCVEEKKETERILDAAGAGTWCLDPDTEDMRVSAHLAGLLGYPAVACGLARGQWRAMVHHEDRGELDALVVMPPPVMEGAPLLGKMRLRTRSGGFRWMFVRAVWQRPDEHAPCLLQGVCVDIDQLTNARADRERLFLQLTEHEQRAQITLNAIADGVLATDAQGRVTHLNPAAQRLTGWEVRAALGRQAGEVFHVYVPDNGAGRTGHGLLDPIAECLQEQRVVAAPAHAVLLSRAGHPHAIGYSAAPLQIAGATEGAVLVIHDLTESKGLLDDLTYQASHDALTGLLNRREFSQRLERTLERLRAEPDKGAALLYMDLDQFKVVNDTCGHAAGDELLQQLATEYSAQVRDRDTLARLGGDEFALIVEHCSIEQAYRVAGKVLATTRAFRYHCAGRPFQVGVSIGLIPLRSDTANVEEALKLADHACYIAKEGGRNRIVVQRSGDADIRQRRTEMHWAARLGEAFGNGQLQLFSQPICALGRSQPGLHYEILLRICDEGGGPIEPALFLPAAERYDLMPEVDRWVLGKTVAWLESDPRRVAELELCSLNVSQRALADQSFRDFAAELLGATRLPCHKLCFEITETGAAANLHHTLAFIDKLKALGCRFALDDFGTGMASLSYLKQIPVDFVKIDGSFVTMMAHSQVDFEMVRFTNEISHVMGRQTIAEYVADQATLQRLQQIGVDYAQGFLLGEPRPLERQPAML